jgi:phospholipase/carboxylesterase
LDVADKLIEEEVKKGISRSRIILGGFSQGAAITSLWGILRQKRTEDRLAGLILTAGYVPLRGRYKDLIVNREVIKDQPLFILHGQNDTLLPLWVAMKGKPVLEEAGFEVNYVTIPGMRHDIPGPAIGYFCMFIESVFGEQAGKQT